VILIIDNYDSFTYNLVQLIGELQVSREVKVIRNDAATIDEIATWNPKHIIISPGPNWAQYKRARNRNAPLL